MIDPLSEKIIFDEFSPKRLPLISNVFVLADISNLLSPNKLKLPLTSSKLDSSFILILLLFNVMSLKPKIVLPAIPLWLFKVKLACPRLLAFLKLLAKIFPILILIFPFTPPFTPLA